jgi:hypothetical protein
MIKFTSYSKNCNREVEMFFSNEGLYVGINDYENDEGEIILSNLYVPQKDLVELIKFLKLYESEILNNPDL